MRHQLLTLLLAIATVSTTAVAQDKQWTVASSYTDQANSGNPLSYAYDGKTNTFWHSPWSSSTTRFPVTITLGLDGAHHIDYLRYTPRQDGNTNGNWKEVIIQINSSTDVRAASGWFAVDTVNFNGSSSAQDVRLGKSGMDDVGAVRFRILSGSGNFASASEIGFFKIDNTKKDAFVPYFEDDLCTKLKSSVTTSEGIEDADVKALVQNLLSDPAGYARFHIGEYEAYRTTSNLKSEMRTNSEYNQFENPTGIYANAGKPMIVIVEGIGDYKVSMSVKNWLTDESSSSYALRNGFNFITPSTTGNTFINYYTNDYKTAPNVKVHIVNGQVQGYFDRETMDNDDWKEILRLHPSASDSTIIICRSAHAQIAYPAFMLRQYCPVDMDSLMSLYEEVQKTMHYMMGIEKYGREIKNRQLFYASNYGFMAAGGNSAYCHVNSLASLCQPDRNKFGFWGVAHEWGHNNQITPGFKWSGCGETTNNIYASWAQIKYGNPDDLRLEDEVTGVNDYSGMRGGRMQTYFEEGLRKGVCWQLQDGPDYHGAEATGANNSRNYDHFVKLVPFWQLNLWGTLAGKCPDIIPMVIEGLRNTSTNTLNSMDNGKMQVNWMKMACDSAKIDLLPFFEKAGMFKEINAYIEDYGAGWNKINASMLRNLRDHVKEMGYPAFTEEINYINGHNYTIYRDCLPLTVPDKLGDGCTINGSFVKVLHSKVQNAVAYETYNSADSLIRITMYALGSDSKHTYTQVLYPGSEDAAYIVAVGYDGTRKKIFQYTVPTLKTNRFYTLSSNAKGGYLFSDNCSFDKEGQITWKIERSDSYDPKKAGLIWFSEERDGKMYLLNPQSGCYLGGESGKAFSKFVEKASAPYFVAGLVNESQSTWTLALNGSGQYLNSYSATNTGFYGGGSSDPNNVWRVKEVTTIDVNIPGVGYRAIYYPFGLEVPEGITAYTAKEIKTVGDTTYVVLSEMGREVPSFTPAILYKGASVVTKMRLIADYGHADNTDDILTGTTLKRTGFKSKELMGISKNTETGRIGFNASASTSMTANFAYILSEKSPSPTTVFITDDATAIQTTEASLRSATQGLTDLTGRRVATPVKGNIYINTRGQKVMFR